MTIPVKLNNPDNEAFAEVVYQLRFALDYFSEDSNGLTLNGVEVHNSPEMGNLDKALYQVSLALDELEQLL